MDSLPNIPTPLKQRVRELRIAFLPACTFLLVLTALFFLWQTFIMPATILGEVETKQYTVLAKEDGLITALAVDRFVDIKKDQQLGIVTVMEDEQRTAELTALEAELRTLKTRIDVDKARNQESITRLRIDLHNKKRDLEAEEATLDQKKKEFERQLTLFNSQTNIIPQRDLDIARRDRDAAQSNVDNDKAMIEDWQKDLQALVQTGVYQVSSQDDTIEKNIQAARERLLLASKPFILKAPIDGKVSAVLKRAGERVVRGEPILTLVPHTSSRVIGYVRQPLNIIPNVNDKVTIRTRSQRRQILNGTIVEVGPSWTPLNPAIIAPDVRRREVGLPILIQLDDNQQLTPGEFVDVNLASLKRS